MLEAASARPILQVTSTRFWRDPSRKARKAWSRTFVVSSHTIVCFPHPLGFVYLFDLSTDALVSRGRTNPFGSSWDRHTSSWGPKNVLKPFVSGRFHGLDPLIRAFQGWFCLSELETFDIQMFGQRVATKAREISTLIPIRNPESSGLVSLCSSPKCWCFGHFKELTRSSLHAVPHWQYTIIIIIIILVRPGLK